MVTSVAIVSLAAACSSDQEGNLADIQIVGVDYELGSMILTNTGASDIRTQGLWVYQNGQSDEFDIFTIEPRATILFSLRDVGGADASGGEIALFDGDSFNNAETMIDYVSWGSGGDEKAVLASDAGLWGPDESVEVSPDTDVILRADPSAIGADSWIEAEDS